MKKIILIFVAVLTMNLWGQSFGFTDNGHGGITIFETTGVSPGAMGVNTGPSSNSGNGGDGDRLRKIEELDGEISDIMDDIESFAEEAVSEETVSEAAESLDAIEIPPAEVPSEEAIVAEAEQNAEAVSAEAEAAGSETAGDPITIVRGEYIQKEKDFILKGPASIERTYRSSNPVTGSFGYGWSSILDCRIMTGIMPDTQNLIDEAQKRIKTIEDSIRNTGTQIIQISGIPDRRIRESYFAQKISSCNENIEKAKQAVKLAETMRNSYGGKNRIDECKEVVSELENILQRYITFQNLIHSFEEKISAMQTERSKEGEILEALITSKQENNGRRKLNERTLFTGTPDSWIETGSDSIVYVDETGIPYVFCRDNSSGNMEKFCPKNPVDSGLFDEIVHTNSGDFILTKTDDSEIYFYSDGLIKEIRNGNKEKIYFDRNEKGKVLSISTSFNEKFNVIYENDFIKEIKNTRDPAHSFSYSFSDNNLESVTDADGDTARMNYDKDGYMTAIEKSDGSRISFTVTQSGAGEKFYSGTMDEEGNSEHFSFDKENRITTFKNKNGDTETFYYDSDLNITRKSDSEGNNITYSYDNSNRVISKNLNGYVTRNSYDEKGNLSEIMHPDGSREIFTYDNSGKLILRTDRDGKVFDETERGNDSETYDLFGNLIESKLGSLITEYTYDKRNRITEVFRNKKLLMTINYEPKKRIETYFNGLKIEKFYNERKNLVKIIETDTVTGEIHTSEISYDRRHLPVSKTVSGKSNPILVWKKTWTPEAQLKTFTEYDPDGKDAVVTEYTYSGKSLHSVSRYRKSAPSSKITETFTRTILNGNIKEVIHKDPMNYNSTYILDASGLVTSYTDSLGQNFSFVYSKGGRQLQGNNPLHGFSTVSYDNDLNPVSFSELQNNEVLKNENFSYDSKGRPVLYKDGDGKETKYQWNKEGLLYSSLGKEGGSFFHYDDLGRTILEIRGKEDNKNSSEYFAEYSYSSDGRSMTVNYGNVYSETVIFNAWKKPVKITDGLGNSQFCTYNLQNLLKDITDPYGNKTIYDYDGKGNLTSITYCDGEKTEYSYNLNNKCVQIKDSEGIVWNGEYDKNGNLLKEQGRLLPETAYTCDSEGRITSRKTGSRKEYFSHNSYGRNTTYTDAKGNSYVFERNALGNIIRERNRLNSEKSWNYDKSGQIICETDFNGNNIYRRGENVLNRFKYNLSGKCIKAENDDSELNFYYNKGGLLSSSEDRNALESINYFYDAAGRRTRLSGCGRDIRYVYGKNNELLEINDTETLLSVKFSYDSRMRETGRTFGNGISISKHYDKIGRMKSVGQKDTYDTIQFAEAYVYNHKGQIESLINHKGQITLFEYDEIGQLTKVWYPADSERINLMKNEAEEYGMFFRADISPSENYTLSSKQISDMQKAISDLIPYIRIYPMQIFIWESFTYDANGNRESKTNPFGKIEYIHDAENRLTEICAGGKSVVKYQYDRNGNLLEEETVSQKVNYSYSASNRMTRVSKTENGICTTRLYNYDAFNRRVIQTSSNGNASRCVYDGFSFEILKEGPVYSNGLFTDNIQNGYFMFEENSARDRSFGGFDFGVTDSATSLPLFVDENVICRMRNSTPEYFGSDIQDSVKSVTGVYGFVEKDFSYNAFGQCISSELPEYGYIGKPTVPGTNLINFGFRDYSPSKGRWNTLDPIRDGTNWFTYGINDPVNFVDMWGQKITLTVNKGDQTMDLKLENENANYELEGIPITTGVVKNNRRKNSDVNRLQKTQGKDTNPTQFPDGTFKITGTRENTERTKEFGEVWVLTNATQILTATDGTQVLDGGYFVHYTKYDYTNGCIGLENLADMIVLAQLVSLNEYLDPGSSIIVVGGSETEGEGNEGKSN